LPAVTHLEISVTSTPSGTFNLSLTDAINNARDPMQNPGQNRIFYKAGQTRMTRKKSDPDDPDNPDDPTRANFFFGQGFNLEIF